jgi:hypothetical protein
MESPILTAREYPTIGSQGAPLDMFFRSTPSIPPWPIFYLDSEKAGFLAAVSSDCQQKPGKTAVIGPRSNQVAQTWDIETRKLLAFAPKVR